MKTVVDYVQAFGKRADEFMKLVSYAVNKKLEIRLHKEPNQEDYYSAENYGINDAENFWCLILVSPTMIAWYCDQIGFKEATPYCGQETKSGRVLNDPCDLVNVWSNGIMRVTISQYGVSINKAVYDELVKYFNEDAERLEGILFEVKEWLSEPFRYR